MKKLLSDKDGDTHVISRKMKIRCIIVIISLVLGGIGGWKLNDFINKEEISTDYLTAKLEDASELTTQKITYTSRFYLSERRLCVQSLLLSVLLR